MRLLRACKYCARSSSGAASAFPAHRHVITQRQGIRVHEAAGLATAAANMRSFQLLCRAWRTHCWTLLPRRLSTARSTRGCQQSWLSRMPHNAQSRSSGSTTKAPPTATTPCCQAPAQCSESHAAMAGWLFPC